MWKVCENIIIPKCPSCFIRHFPLELRSENHYTYEAPGKFKILEKLHGFES
jgi:hypothetical protein